MWHKAKLCVFIQPFCPEQDTMQEMDSCFFLRDVKYKRPRPGFELGSPIPFYMTITVASSAHCGDRTSTSTFLFTLILPYFLSFWITLYLSGLEYVDCIRLQRGKTPPPDTKGLSLVWLLTASDGEVSFLEIWGLWSIPSLRLLPGLLWPGRVGTIQVPPIGQIDLFKNYSCKYKLFVLIIITGSYFRSPGLL